jgi:hypothetical protein
LGRLVEDIVHAAFESHIASLAAVIAQPVGGGVGHDLAEPSSELVLIRPTELREIAVSREASVLHEVGIVELRLHQPVRLKSGQQLQIGSVKLEELAASLFVAAAGTLEQLQWIGMARVIGHRQFLIC